MLGQRRRRWHNIDQKIGSMYRAHWVYSDGTLIYCPSSSDHTDVITLRYTQTGAIASPIKQSRTK